MDAGSSRVPGVHSQNTPGLDGPSGVFCVVGRTKTMMTITQSVCPLTFLSLLQLALQCEWFWPIWAEMICPLS